MTHIKPGDIVELIFIEKHENEFENWITIEEKTISLGDRFKVIAVTTNDEGTYWLGLEGLDLAHPIEKFKKVDSNAA